MGRVAYNIYLLLLSGLMACGILWLIINGVASELIVIVLCATNSMHSFLLLRPDCALSDADESI